MLLISMFEFGGSVGNKSFTALNDLLVDAAADEIVPIIFLNCSISFFASVNLLIKPLVLSSPLLTTSISSAVLIILYITAFTKF